MENGKVRYPHLHLVLAVIFPLGTLLSIHPPTPHPNPKGPEVRLNSEYGCVVGRLSRGVSEYIKRRTLKAYVKSVRHNLSIAWLSRVGKM